MKPGILISCLLVASSFGGELEVRQMTNAPFFNFVGHYGSGASYNLAKSECQMVKITSRITNSAIYAFQLKPNINACCWMTFGEQIVGPVVNDTDIEVPKGTNIYRLRLLWNLPTNSPVLPPVPPIPAPTNGSQ